jgi:hypothetical protein
MEKRELFLRISTLVVRLKTILAHDKALGKRVEVLESEVTDVENLLAVQIDDYMVKQWNSRKKSKVSTNS